MFSTHKEIYLSVIYDDIRPTGPSSLPITAISNECGGVDVNPELFLEALCINSQFRGKSDLIARLLDKLLLEVGKDML